MAGREELKLEQILAASDPDPLAIELAIATGMKTTIVREGPVLDRDPYEGAHHAAMVALQRFGLTSQERQVTPEGDQ